MKKDPLVTTASLVIMSERRMPNCMQYRFHRFICRLISAHRNYPNRICELIAKVPCVELLGVMIEADGCCAVERVCEQRFDLRQLSCVQVQAKPNLCFSN